MNRDEYEKIDRVNWSTLSAMGRSPAHYRHRLLTPREDTDAMKRGRVCHLAVFEPETFARSVAVWTEGRRFGKKWDAFKAKHADSEILTEDEHAQCIAIAAAVRAHAPAVRYLSGGVAEQTVLWEDKLTGIQCKGRLDFIADVGAICDLKTTKNASMSSFSKSVVNFGLHAQAAFYSDGYAASTGKRLPYVLAVVEVEAPYACNVIRIPDSILDLGREHYRGLLEQLVQCRATNKWEFSSGEVELELPRWAMPDDDITGLDLTFTNSSNNDGVAHGT